MALTGLLAPAAFAYATGSTLGQRMYLPSCRTRAFPTSANFESKLAVRQVERHKPMAIYKTVQKKGQNVNFLAYFLSVA